MQLRLVLLAAALIAAPAQSSMFKGVWSRGLGDIKCVEIKSEQELAARAGASEYLAAFLSGAAVSLQITAPDTPAAANLTVATGRKQLIVLDKDAAAYCTEFPNKTLFDAAVELVARLSNAAP